MPRPRDPRPRLSLERAALALSLLAATAAGCIGNIGEGGPPLGAAAQESKCGTAEPNVEPTVARMLNRRELENTVRDLLGVEGGVVDGFPADPIVGFDNHAESLVASSLLVERHLQAAEAIVPRIDLAAIAPCDSPASCIDELIATFGRRAYRRPLSDDEALALRGIFDRAKLANRSDDEAVRLVIQGALLSPQFLYRVERGISAQGGVVPVEPYELASRLSYFLWASSPDDLLLDAAEAGTLASEEELEAQARRMLADPRARDVTRRFHDLWLELYKLPGTKKAAPNDEVYAELLPAFYEETARFTDHVFWESSEGARAYLQSSTGFVNDALAMHYGIEVPGSDDFVPVSFAESQRFGLLTQASLLALHANPDRTSPTKRGQFVRTKLLCQPPPPPPEDIPPLPSSMQSTGSLRERLAEHVDNPACKGCHQLLDPVGFGLEHYDNIGRYRDEENGEPIDASGELLGVEPEGGAFVGAEPLAGFIAESEELSSCLAKQWFRFALGRAPGTGDICSLESVIAGFETADLSLPELLIAIVRSDAFRFKHTEQE